MFGTALSGSCPSHKDNRIGSLETVSASSSQVTCAPFLTQRPETMFMDCHPLFLDYLTSVQDGIGSLEPVSVFQVYTLSHRAGRSNFLGPLPSFLIFFFLPSTMQAACTSLRLPRLALF